MEAPTKKGRLMIWCKDCNIFYYSTDKKFSNHCPKCKRMLVDRKCVRCGHEWVTRNYKQLASVCPKCSSPYWCRERILEKE